MRRTEELILELVIAALCGRGLDDPLTNMMDDAPTWADFREEVEPRIRRLIDGESA